MSELGPTVDLAGAARATGLSLKAIRRRVERGSLPVVMVDGRRRVPVRALLDAGLLVSSAGAAPLGRRGVNVQELQERVARLEREVAELRSALENRS